MHDARNAASVRSFDREHLMPRTESGHRRFEGGGEFLISRIRAHNALNFFIEVCDFRFYLAEFGKIFQLSVGSDDPCDLGRGLR